MEKDKSLIPVGHYCYHADYLYEGKQEACVLNIVSCPYSKYKTINGVNVPYCSYLDKCGWSNSFNDDEFNKLIEYFGSEDNLFNFLSLDLLWDGCKECGENYDEDLGFDDDVRCTEEGQIKYIEHIKDWIRRVKALKNE